jgi:histidinol-phosphatase
MLTCQQMTHGREIEIARKAAEKAAELALRHQRAGVVPEFKSDQSPVTVADKEAERLICSLLEEAFPGDGLLGEEGARKESATGRRWIIDPIDGTRDFVRGSPLWCVMIGLEEAGEVVAGVVHFPSLGYTCWAARGGGAFRNDAPMRASAITDPRRSTISVNSLNRIAKSPFAPGFLEWVSRFGAVRCLGGTPDAMMVAAGQMDGWIEPGVSPWDLAAPLVIMEEAGAVFFDLNGKRTIYGGSAVGCTKGLEQELRSFLVR